MKIEDGTGKGYEAKVNSANRIITESITKSIEHHSNIANGDSWNIIIERTPTATGDCFFYFKNTGISTYVFEGISMRVASAESISIYLNQTGTPSGGNTNTPANLNTSSSNIIDATIQDGVDITGLTGGRQIDKVWFTSTASSNYNFEQDIAVAPGGVLSIYATTGAVALSCVLHVFKEEIL